jgi:hypothetical protein
MEPPRGKGWKMKNPFANPDCEMCNGKGWHGDNGPGQNGNREFVRCECTNGKANDKLKMTPIEQVRMLKKDHLPDGWPAVQMKTLTALADEIDRLQGIIDNHADDYK